MSERNKQRIRKLGQEATDFGQKNVNSLDAGDAELIAENEKDLQRLVY